MRRDLLARGASGGGGAKTVAGDFVRSDATKGVAEGLKKLGFKPVSREEMERGPTVARCFAPRTIQAFYRGGTDTYTCIRKGGQEFMLVVIAQQAKENGSSSGSAYKRAVYIWQSILASRYPDWMVIFYGTAWSQETNPMALADWLARQADEQPGGRRIRTHISADDNFDIFLRSVLED
jgi:hypothetical protein